MARYKTMQPAPVYIANYADGVTVRMSFSSPAGKPLDLDRGKKLCDMVLAGHLAKLPSAPALADARAKLDAIEKATREPRPYSSNFGSDAKAYHKALDAWEAAKTAADEARNAATAEASLQMDNVHRELVEYRAGFQAPTSSGDQVYHPSFGLQPVSAMRIDTLKPKAPSPAKTLDAIRAEIRNAMDAESALARIASMLGMDISVAA